MFWLGFIAGAVAVTFFWRLVVWLAYYWRPPLIEDEFGMREG